MGVWQAIGIGRASAFTSNQGLPGVGLQFEIEMLHEVEKISMEDMGKLSLGETGQMLRDSAQRAVKSDWEAKAQEHSTLGVSHDV